MIIIKDTASFDGSLPVIALPCYLQIIPAVIDYGYFVSGNLILPFVIRKRIIFRWLEFITNIQNCTSREEELSFLDEAAAMSLKLNVDFIISKTTAVFMNYPQKSIYCRFGSYRLDIQKPEKELFDGLHAKHRNVIRKAEKDGIAIYTGAEYFNDVVSLIHETFRRQQQGYLDSSSEYYRKLKTLGKNAEFWLARENDKTSAAAIFLWTAGHTCYYMHGGTAEQHHTGAMNYLMWKAILSMKERGVRYFDFVGARINPEKGSKQEGMQRFKKRFGGVLESGYLFKLINNKVKYILYRMALTFACFFKGAVYHGDMIDIERTRGNT